MRDKKWFVDHLPADGSAQLHDVTSAWYTVGVWGPRARDLLAAATDDDVSNAGFPFGTCRIIEIGGVNALASRISYVGELGWEIYAPMEQGLRLWDTLWDAGEAFGVVPVGIGVYGTTGRLEKGYRAHGAELELEFDLVEAGMARPKVKDADFVGKAAYLAQRAGSPAAILCSLTVDDPRSSDGRRPLHARTRADPGARRKSPRRRQGPAVVRDQRRLGTVDRASTSSCRTCRRNRPWSVRGCSSSTSASDIP